jgi:hypothetical protein
MNAFCEHKDGPSSITNLEIVISNLCYIIQKNKEMTEVHENTIHLSEYFPVAPKLQVESNWDDDTLSSFDFDACYKEVTGSKICGNEDGAVIVNMKNVKLM